MTVAEKQGRKTMNAHRSGNWFTIISETGELLCSGKMTGPSDGWAQMVGSDVAFRIASVAHALWLLNNNASQ
jgi:hypothetical protein